MFWSTFLGQSDDGSSFHFEADYPEFSTEAPGDTYDDMSAVLLRERKQKELFQKHGQKSASKHLIVETEDNDKDDKLGSVHYTIAKFDIFHRAREEVAGAPAVIRCHSRDNWDQTTGVIRAMWQQVMTLW